MSYSPSDVVKDAEVYRELQAISQEFEAIGKMKVLYNPPVRPREGNFCICDGITWNPLGDGIKRPVWYDQTALLWKAF